MSTSIDSFLQSVAVEVPGCSSYLAKDAILAAAIEFCTRSHAWQEEIDVGLVAKGVAEYDISPLPEGSEIISVRQVSVGGDELGPTNRMELASSQGWRESIGQPSRYLPKLPATLVLVPTPSQAMGALIVQVALKPERSATTLPDILFDRWLDAIRAGALSRLLNRVNTVWYDASAGERYSADFRREISIARSEMMRGPSMATLRMEVTSWL